MHSKLFRFIEEFIFPSNLSCLICDAELNPAHARALCDACAQALPLIEGTLCAKCGKPLASTEGLEAYGFRCKTCQEQSTYFTMHRSAAHYGGDVKTMLMRLKYKNNTHVVPFMAEQLHAAVLSENTYGPFDYIIPVPIHFTRSFFRGYNQSALLALALANRMGNGLYFDGLRRVRRTQQLKRLDRAARKEMLRSAIETRKRADKPFVGKRVLLVDDIYTTGTTLNACARALYEAGCERIDCVTVAMGDTW